MIPNSMMDSTTSPPPPSVSPQSAQLQDETSDLSEVRFQTMFEQSPLSMQVLSPDGRTLRVNRAWEQLWDLKLDDLANYNMLEDPQLIKSGLIVHIRQGFGGEPAEIPEIRYDPEQTVQGGRTRWVRAYIYPVKNSAGQVSEVVLIHQDITDQRQAEEARRQSEERYRAYMEQSTEAIWRVEVEHPIPITLSGDEQIESFYREGYMAECNDVMARMYGYSSAEEVVGARLGDLVPREDPDNLVYLRKFIRHGYRLENAESREFDKSGTPRVFSNNLIGMIENGCLVHAWGTKRDITESRRAEEALRESEERFRSMADSAPVLLWVAGTDMLCNWFNKPWLEFTGRTMEQELGNGWTETVYPDDLAGCFETFTTSFKAGQPFRMEYRLRRHDGEYRWVLDTGSPRFTPEGKFFGFIGSCIDITDRKEAEGASARLAAIVESSDDAIIGKSLDNIITSWNRGAERIYGYTAEEVVGQPISMLMPPEYSDQAARIRDHIIRGEGIEHLETIRRRKDGRIIQVALTISPIRDANGTIVGASTIARDITEQKLTESALRESQRFLQSTLDSLSANIAIIDETGKILAVNAAWCRFAEENDFVGEHCGVGTNYLQVCSGSSGPYAAEAPSVVDGIHDVLSGVRDEYYMEYPCHSPADDRWFGMRVTRFIGEGPLRVVIAHENITERKRIEYELREQTEVVETVNEVGQLLAAELDLQKLVQAVTDAARELTDAQYCAFFYNVVDNDGQTHTYYSLPNSLEEAYPHFPMLRNGEIFGPTFRGEEVIRLDDLTQDERYRKSEPYPGLPDNYGPVRSYLAVPVVSRLNEVLGGLFFGHEEPRIFNERAERIVVGLATQAVVAMDNARLFESLERERAQVAASEHRYRSLAEAIPQILWTTRPDGSVDYFNHRWYEYTGLNPEQSLDWNWAPALHPDDLLLCKEMWQRSVETGEDYQVEYRIKRGTDGAFRWHLARAEPLRDVTGRIVKWLGTCTDIDDQKRAQETMRFFAQANVLLASTIDYAKTLENAAQLAVPQLADWCFVDIVENDGAFERVAVAHADPAHADLAQHLKRHYASLLTVPHSISKVALRNEPEFMTEVPDSMLVSVARDAEHLAMLRALDMKSFMCIPLVASRPEGTTHPLGTITFIAAQSGRTYNQSDMQLAEEIARRAALAVDNARLYLEAQQARDTAEAANRAKDEFLATISHELRTPLTAALGWSYLLRSSKLDEETAARALDTIERNIKSQAQIVEDLLDVSRIISGKLSLDVRPLDIRSIIEAAMDTVRPAAEAKSITMRMAVEPGVGPISGDPNRLQQVIWNLLSNAVKFTPKGGEVGARIEQIDSQLSISVTDTGQGIASEFLPFVFDRFRQADATSTRRYGGLGLGLSIVRHIVEMHGGTVRVDSAGEGQGSTFIVKLPLLAVQMREADTIIREPVVPEAAAESPSHTANLHDLRVLVVEDEADARELIAAVIEQFGAEVRSASTAAQGFSILQHWRPDVLVSDIGMPNEDGFSLISKVRSLTPEQGGSTPAVALTAYARAQDRLRTLSAGYQVHVPKPVEPEELAAAVATLAGRHTEEAPAE